MYDSNFLLSYYKILLQLLCLPWIGISPILFVCFKNYACQLSAWCLKVQTNISLQNCTPIPSAHFWKLFLCMSIFSKHVQSGICKQEFVVNHQGVNNENVVLEAKEITKCRFVWNFLNTQKLKSVISKSYQNDPNCA